MDYEKVNVLMVGSKDSGIRECTDCVASSEWTWSGLHVRFVFGVESKLEVSTREFWTRDPRHTIDGKKVNFDIDEIGKREDMY